MDKQNTIIINTQFALFFDTLLDRPDLLWNSINKEFGDIFDTPIIIPVPNGSALQNVPVVQMSSSKDKNININIARSRIDLYIAGGTRQQEFKDIKKNLESNLSKLIQTFNENIKFSRVGFVCRFFIDEENQNNVIANALKENPTFIQGGDLFEIFIRFATRNYLLDSYKVNNFTMIEKFIGPIAGKEERGILITRDFSTIPEEKYDISDINKLNSFIDEAEKNFKLDRIFNILWPEMNQKNN